MMLRPVGDVSCPSRNNRFGRGILQRMKLLQLDREEGELVGEEVGLKLTPVTLTSGVLLEKGPPGGADEVDSESSHC